MDDSESSADQAGPAQPQPWGPPPHTPPPLPVGPPAPMPAAVDPFVLTIGDIGITRTTVVTSNGNAPLRGSQWLVRDMTREETKIPTWAIVMAIVFALLCLLGLFFLLAKERYTVGYVEVSVQSEGLYHVTQLPVSSALQVQQIRMSVSQAQTLAATA